jgi:sulfonate transport system ATP-binding protein
MLALDKVGKIYPNGVHALERFSAEINPGEIVAIIGGSGCGKSTLLRAIAGLDCASSGAVTLDGLTITAPHAKIGIIFQEPRLLPWLTVADNIVCPTRPVRGRASFRVARRSAWPLPARWCRSPRCCCWTSRFRRWTPSRGAICRTICSISGRTRARR